MGALQVVVAGGIRLWGKVVTEGRATIRPKALVLRERDTDRGRAVMAMELTIRRSIPNPAPAVASSLWNSLIRGKNGTLGTIRRQHRPHDRRSGRVTRRRLDGCQRPGGVGRGVVGRAGLDPGAQGMGWIRVPAPADAGRALRDQGCGCNGPGGTGLHSPSGFGHRVWDADLLRRPGFARRVCLLHRQPAGRADLHRAAGGRANVVNAFARVTDEEAESLEVRIAHIERALDGDRKSTRLNSSHQKTSYAVFC